MHKFRPLIYCVLFSFLFFVKTNGQSTELNSLKQEAIQLYSNYFDNELNYINGREYKPYHHPTQDNPYLQSKNGIGSIFIDGKEYADKTLVYDIYKDLLVVNPNYFNFSNIYIQLNKYEVDSFSISFDREHYVFINFKDSSNNGLKEGFYQCLYRSNDAKLLVNHFVIPTIDEARTKYKYNTEHFLLHHNYYHNISSKKKLFKLFPQQKKELKKKIKTLNYSYKKMSNTQLIQLAQYIDTL